MDFHGEKVFPRDKACRAEIGDCKISRIVDGRARKSGVDHGTGGHVIPAGFDAVEIKNCAIVDQVADCQHGSRRLGCEHEAGAKVISNDMLSGLIGQR